MSILINTTMFGKVKFFTVCVLCFISSAILAQDQDNLFVHYTVDLKKDSIGFYWKDDKGNILKSIQNLKLFVESKGDKLKFAMNGGMYKSDNSPQGLFIQNSVGVALLDTLQGHGNFYMKPNGVFYITANNDAFICSTQDFQSHSKIKYATQSGPMLLINGEMHPAFKQGSSNLNVRNGVGILPDGRILFAMSKEAVNFYDFAMFFKRMNCKNALYLDGFVSRTYFPEEKWEQMDENFGVIIGVIK